MIGQKYKSILAENLNSAMPNVHTKKHFARTKKCCWKCQQDKSVIGGEMKVVPGLMKFVCKECVEARKAKA